MYSFNFMGQDSYLDFGLMIEKRPNIPKPIRNIQYFVVPGRDGSLKVDDQTYQDIIIPIQCSFKDTTSVAAKADLIKAWLDSGPGPLILSNQIDKSYTAHVSDQVDITQELYTFGKCLINFRAEPFKYSTANNTQTLFSSGSITNPSAANSRPVIMVMGSGSVNLTINGVTISISSISGSITIDSVLQDAYNGTTLLNNTMTGNFPLLTPGVNTFSWTGSVSSVTVTPNWRWL